MLGLVFSIRSSILLIFNALLEDNGNVSRFEKMLAWILETDGLSSSVDGSESAKRKQLDSVIAFIAENDHSELQGELLQEIFQRQAELQRRAAELRGQIDAAAVRVLSSLSGDASDDGLGKVRLDVAAFEQQDSGYKAFRNRYLKWMLNETEQHKPRSSKNHLSKILFMNLIL